MSDLKDGGYKSRKLWLVFFSLILVTLAAWLCTINPGLVAVYPTFSGSIIALVSVYLTGNITTKYVQNKTAKVTVPEEKKETVTDQPKDGETP